MDALDKHLYVCSVLHSTSHFAEYSLSHGISQMDDSLKAEQVGLKTAVTTLNYGHVSLFE